jgi:MinD-like ATPase involved in chromosome partitioning or flagellar assembly
MVNGLELPSSSGNDLSALPNEQHESIVHLLTNRLPEYASAIASNERLAGALTAAERATPLAPQEIVDRISDRELATAQRPIDVLVSRCVALIRDTAVAVESAISQDASEQQEAAVTPVEPTPSIDPTLPRFGPELPRTSAQGNVAVRRSWRPRMRVQPNVVLPAGADADLVSWPFEGHRYISVIGTVGGSGATTVTVLVGQILALLRGDNTVAVEATQPGGALAFRSGAESRNTITDLLQAEANIRSCNDLGEHIDRLPTRLGVAKSLPGDDAITADEYRRAVDLLARHFDMLITDLGTATTSDAARAALGLADLVIVVTSATEHGVRTSARVLDVLEGQGVGRERVILVVNGVHRRSGVRTDRFIDEFGARCAAQMWLPWDRHLAAGSAVSLMHTHRSTVKSAVRLSAAVVQSMSPTGQRGVG